MKDYKRLTNRDLVLTLNYNNGFEDDKRRLDYASRLWELENKIERGELVDRNAYLDYLMAAKNTLEVTDKEIEFFAKQNARVRGNANAEIARLTAKNAALQKRIENAVELPCKVGDTVYFIPASISSTFELFIYEWKIESIIIMEKGYTLNCVDSKKRFCYMFDRLFGIQWFTDRAAAEARLEELSGWQYIEPLDK